jgi:hypothetical protein
LLRSAEEEARARRCERQTFAPGGVERGGGWSKLETWAREDGRMVVTAAVERTVVVLGIDSSGERGGARLVVRGMRDEP